MDPREFIQRKKRGSLDEERTTSGLSTLDIFLPFYIPISRAYSRAGPLATRFNLSTIL